MLPTRENVLNRTILPFSNAIKRGEGKIRCYPTLPSYELRAAADIILQPRRQTNVIRIALNLTNMKRQCSKHIGNILSTEFNDEIGRRHLPPKFRFNERGLEIRWHAFEGIHDKEVHPYMSAVPIQLMRKENDARLIFSKQRGNGFDRSIPGLRLLGSSVRADFLEARFFEIESDPIAGVLEFDEARGTAVFITAESDGDVDDAHAGFAQETHRESAGDAFVVGMRSKIESGRRAGRGLGKFFWRNATKRKGFAFSSKLRKLRNKFLIWIHSQRLKFFRKFLSCNPEFDRVNFLAMTKPTLLVLAAGMGSRYGGLKQIDPVGPNGETIIDYSIYDAMRAGFGKMVFVIRHDIEEPFKQTIGARFEKKLPVEYVFQELNKLPEGFSVPPGRTKPWGTGQAILLAEDVIREPFAAINGDDFYGANSFRVLAEHLKSGTKDFAMVGFILRNTLSEFGSVARGVCKTNSEGYLESVTEMTKIERDGKGAKTTGADGKPLSLTGDEAVSMNMWGFTPGLFGNLRELFVEFLKRSGKEEKSEFYIPAAVSDMVRAKRAKVKVLKTPDSWFGVTYREDRPFVVEGIRKLIARGEYPEKI